MSPAFLDVSGRQWHYLEARHPTRSDPLSLPSVGLLQITAPSNLQLSYCPGPVLEWVESRTGGGYERPRYTPK